MGKRYSKDAKRMMPSGTTAAAYSSGTPTAPPLRNQRPTRSPPVVATHGRPAAGVVRKSHVAPASSPAMTTATHKTARTTSTMRTSSTSTSSASERLRQVSQRGQQHDQVHSAASPRRDEEAAIVPYLAMRSYHIPGNGWFGDWRQYMANNHPIFGLCCHDKLHPIGCGKRIVVLMGSIASGLAITNLVYLWFLLESEEGIDAQFISLALQANLTIGDIEAQIPYVSVTNYQVFLWTAGAAMHSAFDLSIWTLSACACCLPGGCCAGCEDYRHLGSYIVFFVVIVTAAAASLAVVLRATLNSADGMIDYDNITGLPDGVWDDTIDFGNTDPGSFNFLFTWSIEMLLSLLLYYPALGTILFSGILGCGRLPFLGGRPRDVYLEELHREKERAAAAKAARRRRQSRRTSSSNLYDSSRNSSDHRDKRRLKHGSSHWSDEA